MKICPSCKRTFNDDTLSFCLEDGSPLMNASSSSQAATEVMYQSPVTSARTNQTTPQQHIHTQPPTQTPSQQIYERPSNAGRMLAIFSILFTLSSILFFIIALIVVTLDYQTLGGGIVILSMFVVPIGTIIGLIALWRAFRSRDGKGAKVSASVAITINILFVLAFVGLMLLGAINNYMEGKF